VKIYLQYFWSTLAILVILWLPNLAKAEERETSGLPEKHSLYIRMGGAPTISNVVDDFMEKFWKDPKISHYFRGMGIDTKNKLRQKNKNLMCANTGGGCEVISRPLDIAHRGLSITETEFYIVVDHILVSLKKYGVPEKERDELLAKIRSLKPKIVEITEGAQNLNSQKEIKP
jgi:hemoglobin